MAIDLLSNCDSSLPKSLCKLGNASSFASMIMWFLVLLPQLIRNQKMKSVKGLSALWAAANASASICNLFFVFSIQVPIYTQVMAIYMPVLEIVMLCQFYCFTKKTHRPKQRYYFAVAVLTLWSCIVLIATLAKDVGINYVEWVAVILWCIECIPQLFLNVERGRANGQAPLSLLITSIGKTTDALSAYLLIMPQQTVYLAYYSSSFAWINTIEFIYFEILSSRKGDDEKTDFKDYIENEEEAGFNQKGESLPAFARHVDNYPDPNRRLKIFLGLISTILLSAELIAIATAAYWRLGGPIALILPGSVFVILSMHWLIIRKCNRV